MEVWKCIEGYEGFYQVSNTGLIRSKTREVKRKDGKRGFYNSILIKSHFDQKGYLRVILTKESIRKTFKIHRIVASHFIGNIQGMEINHKDGVKSNNHFSNLEICTGKENCLHSLKTGLKGGVKLNESDVVSIRESELNEHILAENFNLHVSNIRAIKKRKSWKHI